MRNNIFELMAQNNTVEADVQRIIILFEDRSILENNTYGYSLKYSIKHLFFQRWPHRGHCITLDDFLDLVRYKTIKQNALHNIEPENNLLTLIELIYNFWWFTDEIITMNPDVYTRYKDFTLLKTIMDDLLSQFNHTTHYIEKEKKLLVIEDKSEVTAVAEIIKDDLVTPVIKYNHRSLKGDLSTKRSILSSMAFELEPKRQKIKDFNSKLEDNLFYIANNLNIRHNNVNDGHGKYKEFVANMDKETLEEWYDELYQMMLLAFLSIDDIENRRQKVNQLKRNIDG